jgi:putative (di)nucleoside polyphosphate hydrolase
MKKNQPTDLPYRPCVGIMLLNKQGKVWVGRRVSKWHGDGSAALWQMPQGGIDDGEKPKMAAFRELEEETGTSNAKYLAKTTGWLTYNLPDQAIGSALKGRYRGQKQKWFALRFLGEDSEINILPEDHQPEFNAWQWIPMSQLTALVVPFKRDVYAEVVKQFSHLAKK